MLHRWHLSNCRHKQSSLKWGYRLGFKEVISRIQVCKVCGPAQIWEMKTQTRLVTGGGCGTMCSKYSSEWGGNTRLFGCFVWIQFILNESFCSIYKVYFHVSPLCLVREKSPQSVVPDQNWGCYLDRPAQKGQSRQQPFSQKWFPWTSTVCLFISWTQSMMREQEGLPILTPQPFTEKQRLPHKKEMHSHLT